MPHPTIIYEDDEIVVVNKPGLLDSQNSKKYRPSVSAWLLKKYGFSGLVHRLDFGTSGLMVCGKNAEGARKLSVAMREGNIYRTYLAIVLGKQRGEKLPHEGKFDEPLFDEKKQSAKPAVTHYKIIEKLPNAYLVEVVLETGRKHQIRKHFSQAGFPLLGDHLYGKRGAKLLFHRPALHAAEINVFKHVFRASIPKDLEDLLEKLRSRRKGEEE